MSKASSAPILGAPNPQRPGRPAAEELADLAEFAPTGLERLSPDGIVLWANQADLELLGRRREEVVGHHVREFHAESRAIDHVLLQARQGIAVASQVSQVRRPDGSVRHVSLSASARHPHEAAGEIRLAIRDITEQVELARDRRAVMDAPGDARKLLESVTDGYLHMAPDWRITFANLGGGREPRRDRPELIGKLLWEAFPPVAGTQFEEHYRTAMQDRQPRTFEAYYAPADTWLENRLYPAGDGLALYYRDITGRRRLEQQLENRSAQQATIARLGVAAMSRTLDAFLDLVVSEAATTLGLELTKVLQLLPGNDRLLVRAGVGWADGVVGQGTVSAGLESQAGYTLDSSTPVIVADLERETRFSGPSLLREHGVVSGMSVIIQGKDRPWGVFGVHATSYRIFDEDDVNFLQAMANLVASAIDRSGVEILLRGRNRQHAAVARLGQEAISGLGLDHLFATAVQQVAQALEVPFCKLVQLNPDRATLRLRAGVGWREGLVGVADLPADLHTQAGFTLQSDGPVIVTELATETRFTGPSLLHDHGVVSGISVLIRGRTGPFGVLGAHAAEARTFTTDDINFLQSVANLLATAIERSMVEAEISAHRENLEGLVEQRTQQLQAANRELEAFSYTVSHDLRSPLRAMDGFSKVLLRKHAADLPPEAQRMLHMVSEGANRMGNLIESVLSLARIGRTDIHRTTVDVSAMASDVLAGLAKESPRAVQVVVQPRLSVQADPGLMAIVLHNLIGNAWKFTGKATDPRIEVTGKREAGRDTVCISDNGAGFDMAHIEELFQPFHRLHSPGEFEGTGIGLATIHRIIHRHGGRVWAEGTPGKGARFCFELPR